MNKLIKKVVSVVTALAVTLSAAVIFDIPEKISAAAEESHTHKACANSSHENCTHSEVEYEPFPTALDAFKLDLKSIIIEEDKNYYLTGDLTNGTFSDIQICIKDATVNFCLNGHKLDVKGIRVSGKGELNVCDCKTGGCLTTVYENTGGILETRTGGILNIYSGIIRVNDVGIAINCGVHDDNGSDVTNIYGGEINGNIFVGNGKTLSIYGGTVKHETNNPVAHRAGIDVFNGATVNINGGSIVGGEYGIVADHINSTININGGSVESKEKYAIWIQNGTVCNINGGTVKSASTEWGAIYTVDDGVVNINGGEVVGKNYGAVYCHNDSTVKISDGIVRTESAAPTCVYNNNGTLIVSGGNVFGEEYGIRNYNSGTTTISGGTVSCKGTGVYNYSNGVFEINGGEIISENATGISNKSMLTVSGGKVSGGTYGIRNFSNGAATTISGGEVSCKGNICISNYEGGALNITDGKVSGGEYCIYNPDGTTMISGGTVSAKGSYALYNEEKGTAVINGGTLNSTFSPVTNYGTLDISGGSFGAEDPAKLTYMINQKNMKLSGSPVFGNSSIWLKTDDNIGITGELGMSEPCLVYIESYVPRIFTSGWDTHMTNNKVSEYFKSPYADVKIVYRDNEAAMVYYYKISYDANGGSCSVKSAETDVSGKLASLAVPTRDNYSFGGWFTEKTGGEQITADTVFTDDTTIYAHWTCNDHIWGDTYTKDEDHHWKICTRCNTESEKTSHTWDNGTVTKQPSESETGEKIYACTVCNAEKTEELEMLAHTHTYSNEWTSDESGHWHAATCGHDVKDSEAKHDFGTPTVTPSTCTQQGGEEYVCETCGYKKTVTLDPAEHSFDGEWQKDGAKHWKVCTVCNAEKSEEAAHTWNDGEISEQPTEDEAGAMLYTCTVCQTTKTEPIAPLEHTHDWSGEWSKDDTYHWHDCLNNCGEKKDNAAHIWNDGEISEQPTENEAGVMLYTCTVCKATKTEPIAQLVHTHDWSGEWSKDDTYHWHDCLKNCGEKKDNAAHIWDGGTVTKQPTADEEGEKTFECTVCGKTKTETLPSEDEPSDPDSGNISVDVQPGENAPDTELKTPFDELADAVLTPEEQESIKNGIDIKIILIVSDATESVPTDDRAKVEAAIRGLYGYKNGQYLDLNLMKIIGNSEGIRITQTNKPITVTFEIPTALRGKAEYSVIRVHGGDTEVLRDLDNDFDTVTIETDKFSTYALVYKEKNTPSNPSGGNTSGENPGDSPNPPTFTPGDSDNSDDTPSDDDSPSRDDSSDTISSEIKPTDEDNSDAASSDDGNDASSADGNTTSSESNASSNGSDHSSSSESIPSVDNGNPSTGIAISLIPLVTATAILTVAIKRKKK